MKESLFRYASAALDEFLMHDRDLPAGPPKLTNPA